MKLNQLIIIPMLFAFTMHLSAQDSTATDKPTHHEEHYHLSVFSGYTVDYANRNGYKIGVEYEYRLSDRFGIGGTFDYTGADFQVYAFSIGATAYPFNFPLVFGAGVGAKSVDSKWKNFTRTLMVYDFHLNKLSIGPMVMYDFFPAEKDIMTYGLTVGFGF